MPLSRRLPRWPLALVLALLLGACQPPAAALLAAGSAPHLTVEEHAVVAASEDTPNHAEFNQRLGAGVLAKRQDWRGADSPRRLAQIGADLQRFSYRLESRQEDGIALYDLYRGQELAQADLTTLGPLQVSDSGRELAFLVTDRQGVLYLVGSQGLEPWDEALHAYTPPALLGDDLLYLARDAQGEGLTVRAGAKDLYHFTPPFAAVSNPVKGVWGWQGHWFLEVEGQVTEDGRDLNKELGYEQVFAWQLVAGQPFYFFRKDGKIGVSYAGQVLPQRYDDVVHYECCEPSQFNVSGNGQMVVYYALRDGTWYYVEAGVYQGQ